MQRKRLLGIMLIASALTTGLSINNFQSLNEDTREMNTEYKRESIVKILKIQDEYIEERLRKEAEEQALELARIEEERRLEEEILRKERESKRVYTTFELSAYCSCNICSEGWGTQTASGEPVQEGFVALPKDIPFGTKVIIPSINREYVCKDRGGFIEYTNEGYMRVDIYMSSHQACLQFGRFTVEGYLEYE